MSECSRCGAPFDCAMADGADEEACWCTRIPLAPLEKLAVTEDGDLQTCMCPVCLQALTATE